MLSEKIIDYCRDDVCDIRGFERCEFVSAERGRFEMRAHPGPDCGNNVGTVHGGFLLALADMAGSGVADTCGFENVTMSMTSNFLRPARIDDAFLRVVGTAVHAGRRSVVSEVVISRPNGEVAFKATCTMAMFADRPIDPDIEGADERGARSGATSANAGAGRGAEAAGGAGASASAAGTAGRDKRSRA